MSWIHDFSSMNVCHLLTLPFQANPPCLLSTIQYISNFYASQLSGEECYWWMQFTAAVEFIKTIDERKWSRIATCMGNCWRRKNLHSQLHCFSTKPTQGTASHWLAYLIVVRATEPLNVKKKERKRSAIINRKNIKVNHVQLCEVDVARFNCKEGGGSIYWP